MRDWIHGGGHTWVSMGVASDGSYGIPEGLVFGVPVRCSNGAYERIGALQINAFAREMIDASIRELAAERDAVRYLLNT